MKILDKKEINKEKSEQERKEVANALSLARKTDAIRELMSTEESNLRKFREESLKRVQEELTPLIEEHANLKKEVISLEERRKKALIPLNEEWTKVREKQDLQLKEKLELDVQYSQFFRDRNEIDKRLNLVKVDEQRIETAKSNLEKERSIVQTKRLEADKHLSGAESVKQEADEYYRTKTNEIVSRETKLGLREKDLAKKISEVKEYENELRVKEIQLIDREETLDREIKRQNGKR